MLKYKLTKDALNFLKSVPKKHAQQIIDKINQLAENKNSVPTIKLQGFDNLYRGKSGEYRFIFRFENGIINILVLKIGKRNDGEVYKNLDSLDN